MIEKQVDVEINKILKSYFIKLVKAIRLHYKRVGKHYHISEWISYWEDRKKDRDEMVSLIKFLFRKKARECEPYISEYRKGDGEKECHYKMGFNRCNKEWIAGIDQKFK